MEQKQVMWKMEILTMKDSRMTERRNRCLIKDKVRHQIRLSVYDEESIWRGQLLALMWITWLLWEFLVRTAEMWRRANIAACLFFTLCYLHALSFEDRPSPSTCLHPATLFGELGVLETIETECSVLQEWQWERLPFFTAEERVRGTILSSGVSFMQHLSRGGEWRVDCLRILKHKEQSKVDQL